MTAPSSLLDLDDVDALLAADVEGSLRFAALGGAQIRATQAAVDEGELARLHGFQPRSVVLVTGVGAAARAADLLIATVGGRIGIPLVETTVTPLWVGPLDVVVVAGDDAGDPQLVESVDRALRRGAEVVVAGPDEGPLRAAGAGRAHALPPRVAVPDHNALLRYLAAFLAVLVAIESGRAGAAAYPDLGRLADALDDEALRDHPRNEVFHNPAKSLAARMQGRRVVLAGATRATTHLARHAGDVLLRTGAAVAAAADLAEVIAGVPRFAAATPLGADYDPFFHDEQLDGPAPGMPLRVFVLASDADRPLAERRAAALADADVDVVVATSEQAGPPGPAGPVDPVQPTPVGAVGEIEQTAVLVCRLEMSAAYLRLIGGN